jgi:hypothetical protein
MSRRRLLSAALVATLASAMPMLAEQAQQGRTPAGVPVRFEICVPAAVHSGPITGRVYVMLTRNEQREPRLQLIQVDGIPFFGRDVEKLAPGATAVIDDTDLGFPVDNLRDIPPGGWESLALHIVQKKPDGAPPPWWKN